MFYLQLKEMQKKREKKQSTDVKVFSWNTGKFHLAMFKVLRGKGHKEGWSLTTKVKKQRQNNEKMLLLMLYNSWLFDKAINASI